MKNLLKILPIHIFLWIGLAYYALLKWKPRTWIWIHKAIWWNIINISKTFKKREIIQSRRIKTDTEIFIYILKKRPFSYYTHKVRYIKVGNNEGFIKS